MVSSIAGLALFLPAFVDALDQASWLCFVRAVTQRVFNAAAPTMSIILKQARSSPRYILIHLIKLIIGSFRKFCYSKYNENARERAIESWLSRKCMMDDGQTCLAVCVCVCRYLEQEKYRMSGLLFLFEVFSFFFIFDRIFLVWKIWFGIGDNGNATENMSYGDLLIELVRIARAPLVNSPMEWKKTINASTITELGMKCTPKCWEKWQQLESALIGR